MNEETNEKIVTDVRMPAACREQYRRLAASLHRMHGDGLSIVMIASAVPGEGKTLTAANLALTLSQSYQRDVLLIDADLRRPRLHEIFAVDNDDGLRDYLDGSSERRLPVREVAPRLSLLPAGEPTSDPMGWLTSSRMKRLLGQAPDTFDWILIDTPAIGVLPDAGLLASMVDGVVMVVGARSTRCEPVRRAIEAIGRQRIVGVVLNRADLRLLEAEAGSYGRYYYRPDPAGV